MVILYNLNVKLNTSILLEQLALDDKIIKVEKKGFLTRGTSLRDKVKKRSKKTKENATETGSILFGLLRSFLDFITQ